MAARCLVRIALLSVCLGTTVRAEPYVAPADPPTRVDPPPPVEPPPLIDKDDLPVLKQSYVIPALEIVLFNLVMSLTSYAAGADWGVRDSDTWFEHLTTTPWELDDDAYTTNQLAHPFCGALSFTTARSMGHNFWVSGIYSFAGSAVWEGLIENETPSFNDMLTTPIGGMFVGEVVHRFARALRYPGYGKPTFKRKAAAALVDPVGAINRAWWGEAWAQTTPPALYAHLGIGAQLPTRVYGNRGGDTQLHLELYAEYGLLADPTFVPRRPFDHFELYADLNLGADNTEGALYVRGVLLGGSIRREQTRSIYGLFGTYDFNNNDYVRASVLGFGPGGILELEIGERGYIAATLAAYLVPYGAAGGFREVEGPMRDSHDGPGLAQLGEIKLGQRGLFQVRFTTRASQIAGRMVNDLANEYVVQTIFASRFQVATHHAIGVEAVHTWEHATFEDPSMDGPSNSTTDFRIFYALTTDEILGR